MPHRADSVDLAALSDSAVIDLIPIGVLVAGVDGTIEIANQAMRDLLGAEVVDRRCWELIELPGGPDAVVDRARRAAAAGRVAPVEVTATAHHSVGVGTPVSVTVRAMPADGNRVVVTARQLGEEFRQAIRLRAFEDKFEQVATSVPTGILSSEFGMRADFANERCTEIFGAPAEDLVGFGWLDRLHPDDGLAAEEAIAEVLTECTDRHLSLRVVHPRSGERRAEVHLSPVSPGGGRDVGFVATINDVTERLDLNEQLVAQALQDPLTGLPNRTALWQHLERVLAEDRGHPAVLFIDLDDFKDINDSLGHTAGDELLVEMAARLRRCARSSDTLIRFGGDEFVLLLRYVPDRSVVDRVAERVLATICEPVDLMGQDSVVTASIGIVWPEGPAQGASELDVEGLLRDADIALFHAKRKGKNRAERLDEEMRDGAQRRIGIAAALRRAVDTNSDELSVHFQPIVDLAAGRVVGMEALARWTHPELGSVSPVDFIPVAEESGLITSLARRILERALAPMRDWRSLPGCSELFVAVNMSARDLTEPMLAGHVEAALHAFDLPGEALHLELTESAVMTDPAMSLGTLGALKALGPSISIDDFGTGYSSLAHLHRLPVDTLKIDREFIAALDRSSTAMIEAIVALSGALGLPVVAEGVETVEQAAILTELGVPLAQGYLFSHPVPADEITALITLLAGGSGMDRSA
ncbi:MAG: putative bifunctional diguanylate cyclase/phosphodiesterase [Acidimicrobiales bacterium]